MRPFKEFPIARLKERLSYREDGRLVWIDGRKAGKIAGCLDSHGYVIIKIDGCQLYLHRCVFAMHHGYWPAVVDHIDNTPTNNMIENLRELSDRHNRVNSNKTNAKSGFRGVGFHKGRYVANIKHQYISRYLGRFDTAEEAHAAYLKARESLSPGVVKIKENNL